MEKREEGLILKDLPLSKNYDPSLDLELNNSEEENSQYIGLCSDIIEDYRREWKSRSKNLTKKNALERDTNKSKADKTPRRPDSVMKPDEAVLSTHQEKPLM